MGIPVEERHLVWAEILKMTVLGLKVNKAGYLESDPVAEPAGEGAAEEGKLAPDVRPEKAVQTQVVGSAESGPAVGTSEASALEERQGEATMGKGATAGATEIHAHDDMEGPVFLCCRLRNNHGRLARSIIGGEVSSDVPRDTGAGEGRQTDVASLGPGMEVGSLVVDTLLTKFLKWLKPPPKYLGVVPSEVAALCRLNLSGTYTEVGWKKIVSCIATHEFTLIPLAVPGHWVGVVVEKSSGGAIFHVYNSLSRVGKVKVTDFLDRLEGCPSGRMRGLPSRWVRKHWPCQQQRNSVDCAPFMLVRLMKIGYAVVKGTSAPGEKLGCPDLDRVRERLALLCHAPAEEWDALFATPPRQI
jgi:hypothetical protein